MELYKKYRPKNLKQVIGNTATVQSLKNMLERKTLPHTILFHGPSGCGKTTLARILKKELNCSDMDFNEMNCSDFRGIDTIREISRSMNLSPTAGSCRIWLLDEVHQLSKDAMNASLKIWEDTPKHVYFILCTTDPQKLLKTIRTRCCEMPVELLNREKLKRLLKIVIKREKIDINEENIEDIIDSAEGSARASLVMLDKMTNLSEDQREGLANIQENEKEVIELCRALIKKQNWNSVCKIIKGIQTEPESVRWAVLGYAKAVLLNKADSQAFRMIECFRDNFYDSKQAGLVGACFEVICGE